MKKCLEEYSTLIFDCDGVVLNSNSVKTEAFYQTALPYGEVAAQSLVDYHVKNGGISRYKKFKYFLDKIIEPGQVGPSLDELLSRYATLVRYGLMNCDVAEGLAELRKRTASARWLIVSGGDQAELREVFAARKLKELFDGGIFGSPDTKDHILTRELKAQNIIKPALFIGDSKYDYQSACNAKLDFIFLMNWSEVSNWKQWCSENSITFDVSISSLF